LAGGISARSASSALALLGKQNDFNPTRRGVGVYTCHTGFLAGIERPNVGMNADVASRRLAPRVPQDVRRAGNREDDPADSRRMTCWIDELPDGLSVGQQLGRRDHVNQTDDSLLRTASTEQMRAAPCNARRRIPDREPDSTNKRNAERTKKVATRSNRAAIQTAASG